MSAVKRSIKTDVVGESMLVELKSVIDGIEQIIVMS